ncbi:MAG: Spy/CpxP family protein refolding chaperone [Pseudomonadota bacterium]
MQSGRGFKFALMLAVSWVVCGVALAQGTGDWQGRGGGPGLMGAYGGGPSQGMGPRWGGGPGYGPGYATGYGMMAGAGHRPGPGMMQSYREARLRALGLKDEQRAKIDRIREETRQKNWNVIGQIRTERFKLREMYRADKINAAGIVDQQRKVDDLRRQVLLARLEARNQVFALLTPEQRQKARAFGPPRRGFGR